MTSMAGSRRRDTSLLGSFAAGFVKDKAVIGAALTELWSNERTKGQITRLKLVKRQMFDRSRRCARSDVRGSRRGCRGEPLAAVGARRLKLYARMPGPNTYARERISA